MPVETRMIRRRRVDGVECVGAVQAGARTFVGVPSGTGLDRLKTAWEGRVVGLRPVGQSLLAIFPASEEIAADTDETSFFAGMNTLVAFRNGERAGAVRDWLAYHSAHHEADAALIFDRAPPVSDFADELAQHNLKLPVVVVNADTPLGMAGGPDARHPGLAPAAPKREMPPVDPWHAPLGQLVLYELLRRRFLSQARAVIFLDIPDVLQPDSASSAFARVQKAAGHVVLGHGLECYPWRLRQDRPAPHSDHIALRRQERRWLSTWGTVPAALPDASVWKPVRVGGAPLLDAAPFPFRRAVGVAFPGVPVNRLVRKADLVEEPALLEEMSRAFAANPIRLPQPKPIAPRPENGRVTVVTAMKNEGPFILDWIAHNRAIGVDQHLVYTNDCEDGTEALLDLLSEAGVTRRDNAYRDMGKVPQYAAFRAAEDEPVVQDADWLLTLDVDEYINIHVGEGRIPDLLEAAPHAHVFSMPWRLFGNADRTVFEDQPVTEQFTQAAPAYASRPLQAWAFKSLYRNAGLFRRLGVHRPKGLQTATQSHIRWVDGRGKDIPPNTWRACWRVSKANWGYDLVTLNHYAVRSAESFLVKRDRGRVNHVDRDQGAAYWFRMNHNAEDETSILRHATKVAAEKARLLALPGVAAAHASSVAWHRSRIAQLKFDPDHTELFAKITSRKLQKLSRMATFFGANVHYFGPDTIPDEIADRDPSVPFFFTVDAKTRLPQS
jgi:hypothetical protein